MIDPDTSGYWRTIEQAYKDVTIYEGPAIFLERLSRWPEHVGNLLAAHWVRSEVFNGGLIQFFQNRTGVLAPEAVRGLHALGLPEAAAAVAEAMSRFGEPYPRDHGARLDATESASWQGDLDALDKRFYGACGDSEKDANGVRKDAFDRAADAYAARFPK